MKFNANGHETDKSFPSNGINFLPALLIADFLAIIFGIDEHFPRKLTEEEIKLYSRLFPNFDPTKVTVIGPATDRLNCIAHACGLNSGWIDHSKGPPNCAVKPPKAALAITLEYAEQVLACYGFAKSENCKCEKRKIKVALYGLKRKGFGAGMIYHV